MPYHAQALPVVTRGHASYRVLERTRGLRPGSVAWRALVHTLNRLRGSPNRTETPDDQAIRFAAPDRRRVLSRGSGGDPGVGRRGCAPGRAAGRAEGCVAGGGRGDAGLGARGS